MTMHEFLDIKDGIGRFCPIGQFSLVEAEAIVADAIAACRDRGITRLLVNANRMTGIHVPTMVERFLIAEEWAQASQGAVVLALVIPAEYIHPRKFGVAVAADRGLVSDVFTSESEALGWLSSIRS
jgi:hypothetical protein